MNLLAHIHTGYAHTHKTHTNTFRRILSSLRKVRCCTICETFPHLIAASYKHTHTPAITVGLSSCVEELYIACVTLFHQYTSSPRAATREKPPALPGSICSPCDIIARLGGWEVRRFRGWEFIQAC